MPTQTVVAVYGVTAGTSRVKRLGSGMLAAAELVVVDPPLDAELAGSKPPRVLRVGLGSAKPGGELSVEVREVRQVLESVETTHGRLWALALAEPAKSPAVFGPNGPDGPSSHSFSADELADLVLRHRARLAIPVEVGPADPAGRPRRPPGPHTHPALVWCRAWPNLWFCPKK